MAVHNHPTSAGMASVEAAFAARVAEVDPFGLKAWAEAAKARRAALSPEYRARLTEYSVEVEEARAEREAGEYDPRAEEAFRRGMERGK